MISVEITMWLCRCLINILVWHILEAPGSNMKDTLIKGTGGMGGPFQSSQEDPCAQLNYEESGLMNMWAEGIYLILQ